LNSENIVKREAADAGIDDSVIDAMVTRAEETNIFKQDGVDIEQLRKRLNNMQRHLDNPRVPAQKWSKNVSDSKKIHVSMASLVAAACGYDALCAGVNQSIGNAFKEEGSGQASGQDTVFLNPR